MRLITWEQITVLSPKSKPVCLFLRNIFSYHSVTILNLVLERLMYCFGFHVCLYVLFNVCRLWMFFFSILVLAVNLTLVVNFWCINYITMKTFWRGKYAVVHMRMMTTKRLISNLKRRKNDLPFWFEIIVHFLSQKCVECSFLMFFYTPLYTIEPFQNKFAKNWRSAQYNYLRVTQTYALANASFDFRKSTVLYFQTDFDLNLDFGIMIFLFLKWSAKLHMRSISNVTLYSNLFFMYLFSFFSIYISKHEKIKPKSGKK